MTIFEFKTRPWRVSECYLKALICYLSPCSHSLFHLFLCKWNVRPVWLIFRWYLLLSHLFFSQSSWSCWTSPPCCRCWRESSWSCRTAPSHCWGVRQLNIQRFLRFSYQEGKYVDIIMRWWSRSTHTAVMSRSRGPGSRYSGEDVFLKNRWVLKSAMTCVSQSACIENKRHACSDAFQTTPTCVPSLLWITLNKS